MKLTKTDFNEQSLVVLPRTKYLIREAIEGMLSSRHGSVQLRDEAMALKQFLESPETEDCPTLFRKSRSLCKCLDCAGSGQEKHIPEDLDKDVYYTPCTTCQGEGQLYLEVTQKGYIPTEVHRRKFAK